ncbi:TniB family NTP-binding protein [Microvirga lenta]|uniref:TniB family NTP-binding protein n=1 Tax=Microvirga lenta TaxID=2881337 RepID=UPI001CFFB6B5|nr:TniB family NTP-binding protein [Microvirga lenta]MCB5175919.1 TniB family NTP-binding protein [Microvirga lenta]
MTSSTTFPATPHQETETPMTTQTATVSDNIVPLREGGALADTLPTTEILPEPVLDLTQGVSRSGPITILRDLGHERIIARIERLNAGFIRTGMYEVLKDEITRLKDLHGLNVSGRRVEGRALVVVGDSGAGKSAAIARLIASQVELQPRNLAVGPVVPIVSITAPSPFTPRALAMEVMNQGLGYGMVRDIRENVAYSRLREQLRVRQVRIVHIDEMQHALSANNAHEMQKLSDTLKNLMQHAENPVSLILSGLPALVDFVKTDVQLQRRCRFVRFTPLSFPEDVDGLRLIVRTVSEGLAELTPVDLLGDEFLARLCRAAGGQFGLVIQICRAAAEEAIRTGAEELTPKHFASAYAAGTGCAPDENLFTVRDWEFVASGFVPTAVQPEAPTPSRRKGGRA